MSHDSIEHQPHLEDAERDPLLAGTLTRRQFAVGGLTLGAAALLATKGVSVAEAAGAAKGSLVPTKFFHERINDVKAYPEKGTCVVLLGAGGGPDAYFNHGGSVAIWSRGSVYLVDFGIGMHRQFFSARLAPKSLRAVFLSHLHSDHFASLYPFFSEAYYYFLPPVRCDHADSEAVRPTQRRHERARRQQRAARGGAVPHQPRQSYAGDHRHSQVVGRGSLRLRQQPAGGRGRHA